MYSILIVDDEPNYLIVMSELLRDEGFEVFTASNGREGLQAVKDVDLDLVITDVNMPNLDGISFIRKARELAKYRFTPILVLTTESQGTKMNEGKEAGATGWIVKPFSADKLLGIVRKVAE